MDYYGKWELKQTTTKKKSQGIFFIRTVFPISWVLHMSLLQSFPKHFLKTNIKIFSPSVRRKITKHVPGCPTPQNLLTNMESFLQILVMVISQSISNTCNTISMVRRKPQGIPKVIYNFLSLHITDCAYSEIRTWWDYESQPQPYLTKYLLQNTLSFCSNKSSKRLLPHSSN